MRWTIAGARAHSSINIVDQCRWECSRRDPHEGHFVGHSVELRRNGSVIDPAARARLDQWKQSLLDPTDPLIHIGEHGVPIAVDPVRIAFALAGGSLFPLEGSEVAKLRRVPANELWLGWGC